MKIFKISIFAVLIFLFALTAWTQDWVSTNQVTTAWDAVTYELTTGERLMYRTYLANAQTDPNKTNPSYIGETASLQYQFTFTQKGSYFVGVRSVVQVDHDGVWEDAAESEIGWSDDPQYAQAGATFGIRFYPVPPVPTGQRPVSN